MKTLILIRHAKSSWDTPVQDKDRLLNQIGIKDAHLMAQEAAQFFPKSYFVMSSKAKRAAETALIFAQNLNWPIESIQFLDDLYTFDAFKLENIIKSCDNRYENVILFGHNAAITDFVNKFGDVFIDNVPTAGMVSISFATNSWSTIAKGKTNKLLFPRELRND